MHLGSSHQYTNDYIGQRYWCQLLNRSAVLALGLRPAVFRPVAGPIRNDLINNILVLSFFLASFLYILITGSSNCGFI